MRAGWDFVSQPLPTRTDIPPIVGQRKRLEAEIVRCGFMTVTVRPCEAVGSCDCGMTACDRE